VKNQNKKLKPEILFEDPNIIVLSKPAGLLSQGGKKGEANLVDWLRQYLGRHYVGLVHRLDRNVSGLMIVAKRSKAARRLTEDLQKGEIHRTYLGWVVGSMKREKLWMHYLIKDKQKNEMRIVYDPLPQAKHATLRVRPIGFGKWHTTPVTLVEFKLVTGRSHQIRIQAKAEDHPLLGDPKYGTSRKKTPEFGRPALHSYNILFHHPISKEIMSFEDRLPEDMKKIKVQGLKPALRSRAVKDTAK